MSAAVSKLNLPAVNESGLRADAHAVEELRRKIAAASAAGVAAEPALLAEFARTRNAWLNRKIEFETLQRLGQVPAPELPAVVPTPVVAEAAAPVVVPEKHVLPGSSPAAMPAAPVRKPATRWVWWALLIATISVVASILSGQAAWNTWLE